MGKNRVVDTIGLERKRIEQVNMPSMIALYGKIKVKSNVNVHTCIYI